LPSKVQWDRTRTVRWFAELSTEPTLLPLIEAPRWRLYIDARNVDEEKPRTAAEVFRCRRQPYIGLVVDIARAF